MRLVTIFERFQPVHKYKDVGQLHAGLLARSPDWTGELWCEGSEGDRILKRWRVASVNLHVILLLLIKGKGINVLCLYHLRYYSAIYSFIYKLINPDGVVYLKGDFDLVESKKRGVIYSGFFGFTWLTRALKSNIDIVSSEHRELIELLEIEGFKSLHIPNSPSREFISYARKINDSEVTQDSKRKLLFVGRIGTYQKNVEFFIDALKEVSHNFEFDVTIMGPIEDEFQSKLESGVFEIPSNVVFTGPIVDLETITEKYHEADALIMTSRYEGFPLCSVEAMFSRCLIIANHTSGVSDLIRDGDNGYFYESRDELTELISKVIRMPSLKLDELKTNAKATVSDLLWDSSIDKIKGTIRTFLNG